MNGATIEDVLRIAPLQQGILFQTLYSNASMFVEQFSVTINAPVAINAYQLAWQKALIATRRTRRSIGRMSISPSRSSSATCKFHWWRKTGRVWLLRSRRNGFTHSSRPTESAGLRSVPRTAVTDYADPARRSKLPASDQLSSHHSRWMEPRAAVHRGDRVLRGLLPGA